MSGQNGSGPTTAPAAATAAAAADGPPPAKRPRTEALAGVTVWVPKLGLPAGKTVYGAWQLSVAALGGVVTQDPQHPGITHAVVPFPGKGWAALPAELQPDAAGGGTDGGGPGPAARPHYVKQQWVIDSLRRVGPQPDGLYAPPAKGSPEAQAAAAPKSGSTHTGPGASTAAAGSGASRGGGSGSGGAAKARKARLGGASSDSESDSEGGGRMGQEERARWLGPLWRPELGDYDLVELALQGDYDEERCRRIGNEHVVECLRELKKFEIALNGAFLRDAAGHKVGNHKSLNYAQAAAAVRTCAYRLKAPVKPGQLPWVAGSTAADVNQILQTGTCDKLERFRRDEPVRDSHGALRPDSAGAATRRRFTGLLNVGSKTAQQWWDAGLRTYEDVLEAAAGRWPPGSARARAAAGGKPAKPLALTAVQRYGLEHRADLLEGPTDSDLEEMRRAVLQCLDAASGVAGWQLELVGGSRRQQRPEGEPQPTGRPHHDADFMASHPTHCWDPELAGRLKDELLARMHIAHPDTGAMCNIQQDRAGSDLKERVALRFSPQRPANWNNQKRMLDMKARLLAELEDAARDAHSGGLKSDRLDHLFGIFITSGGRVRRMDIILAPPSQLPFGLISWIGSTQLNRFLRRAMNRRGMHLSSHGLYRVVDGQVVRVPEEAPPVDRKGRPHWPQGWGPESGAEGDNRGGEAAAAAAAAAAAGGGGHSAVEQAEAAAAAALAVRTAGSSNAAAAAAAGTGAAGGGSRRVPRTMADVFELLGFPYREPYQRDCP